MSNGVSLLAWNSWSSYLSCWVLGSQVTVTQSGWCSTMSRSCWQEPRDLFKGSVWVSDLPWENAACDSEKPRSSRATRVAQGILTQCLSLLKFQSNFSGGTTEQPSLWTETGSLCGIACYPQFHRNKGEHNGHGSLHLIEDMSHQPVFGCAAFSGSLHCLSFEKPHFTLI